MNVERATTATTYASSAGAFFFGMTANELAAIGGLAIAGLSMLIGWWYKHQRLEMDKEQHRAQMAEIRASIARIHEAKHDQPKPD